jgi:hypothetical protein
VTGLAALAAIAGPVAFVATTAGGPESAGADAEQTSTSFLQAELVRAQAASEGVPFDAQSVLERAVVVASTTTTAAPTTTTAPPPAPTTTAPPPPPAPAPEPAPAPAPASGGDGYADPNNPAAWDRLAQCESGGNWAINTGNGYYGGLQFSLSSWQGVGGTGYPHEHSRETQIAMGQRLHAQGGWNHWPGCARQLGYI